LIPGLDAIVERAAELGVEQFVMGMAHRGRLNVLTNIFGKSPKDIFSEFEGKDYQQEIFDGDVKYHLGWTSARTSDNGHKINMNIAPNPSHLETVGAVVEGITRAKQEEHCPDDFLDRATTFCRITFLAHQRMADIRFLIVPVATSVFSQYWMSASTCLGFREWSFMPRNPSSCN
jgi:hypothetical protein